jgi:hypothetical protein
VYHWSGLLKIINQIDYSIRINLHMKANNDGWLNIIAVYFFFAGETFWETNRNMFFSFWKINFIYTSIGLRWVFCWSILIPFRNNWRRKLAFNGMCAQGVVWCFFNFANAQGMLYLICQQKLIWIFIICLVWKFLKVHKVKGTFFEWVAEKGERG